MHHHSLKRCRYFDLLPIEIFTLNHQFQLMYQADFWLEPSTVNRPVHVMVPPQSVSFITMAVESFGMDVTDYISDVSVYVSISMIIG